jgi:putative ABC transport system permease protein
VGGVGVANIMLIAVLERRGEIGLRRALGATRRQIAAQFLAESLAMAALGGASGVAIGTGIVAAYAASRGWQIVIPPIAIGGGFATALLIGAAAGLGPAIRASHLSPTDALRAP